MKTILFCGNGMSGEAIPRVRGLGYRVLVLTDFPDDIGTDRADRAVHVEAKDPGQALAAARRLHAEGYAFDGVMSLCWDCAISVATVAEEFGLPGVSVETARRATLKSLRSAAFAAHGVPAPAYRVVGTGRELWEAVGAIGLPVVLKPVDGSSAKGVVLVEERAALPAAYRHARSFSRRSEVIVNEYVRGTEYSTECLVIDGVSYPTALSERVFRYEQYKPYFVEVGDILPVLLPAARAAELHEVTARAARAVGIVDGVAKADLIVRGDGKVFVLELAARLGGPRFGTEMVPLSNGTDILTAAVQQAVGDRVDRSVLRPRFSRGVVNRSLFPRPGVVRRVAGLAAARALPGFYDFKWWGQRPLAPGDVIAPPCHGSGGVGYIIATGETRGAALENADRIEQAVTVETC